MAKAIKKAGFKYRAEIAVIIAIVFIIAMIFNTSKSFASEKFWVVMAGDNVLTAVSSKETGEGIIKDIKKQYVIKGASDVSVEIDPVLKVKYEKFGMLDKKPEMRKKDEAIKHILNYNDSLIEVRVRQKIKSVDPIKPNEEYEVNPAMDIGEEKISEAGDDGIKKVVKEMTIVNGKVVNTDILSSVVLKKPVKRVYIRGPKNDEIKDGLFVPVKGVKVSADGKDVVDYALKFLGNPYVHGGNSLTRGCDCSGFTKLIYQRFGIKLPRSAKTQAKGLVRTSNPKRGDLVWYPKGHVGIYMGNGKIVHAANPRLDITISGVRCCKSPHFYKLAR